MNTEALFNSAIDEDDDVKLIQAIKLVMNEWVFFFFNEKEGKNTPSSSGNVAQILITGKDNPINIPLIQDVDGVNGVIYFTMEKARNSVEFSCKIAKMRGYKAFSLFYELEEIDAIYLQANDNNVRIPRSEMKKFLSTHQYS